MILDILLFLVDGVILLNHIIGHFRNRILVLGLLKVLFRILFGIMMLVFILLSIMMFVEGIDGL